MDFFGYLGCFFRLFGMFLFGYLGEIYSVICGKLVSLSSLGTTFQPPQQGQQRGVPVDGNLVGGV